MRKLCLILAAVVLTTTARAEFRQKRVHHLAIDDPRVPPTVRATARPTPWTNAERGPVPDLQFYARESSEVAWLGGPEGAARFDAAAKHPWDRWQFFAGPRWLRGNFVQNIVTDDGPGRSQVWIRTEQGVSLIEWTSITLAAKAAHFEELIERHHVRHGFVADCRLREPGDLATSFTSDNDNDGLWTAMYLAAQSYRFAVTGEPDARQKANRAFEAIVRLLDITGHPGFPARSLAAKGEAHDHGEWHPTPDGQWSWKGDTSSDEIVGHFYGHALFYDLVADEDQKKTVRRVLRAITDHLLAHDDDLIDLDGQPTRWGQWSERYFATEEGRYERALRSVQLLAFLKTAHHVTNDPQYAAAYDERVRRGYASFTREYRRWEIAGEINFSDDELYYLSVDPLLRYERNDGLRRAYLDSVTFVRGEIRSDRNPLWNFISAASGAGPLLPSDRADARRTLERIPWLPIEWGVRNSRRTDIQLRPEADRFGRRELQETLPPDERPQHKWNGNPYVPDGGSDGRSLECGTYYLLPYWMGRYHGWIDE